MSETEDCTFSPEDFGGQVRLFPLPNLVMFPYVMQPLHVFEPRYRELVEAALREDRTLAMGLLKPGWEPFYDERPPVEPIACLCKIASCRRLDDGRYNLMLLGLGRVRLVDELPPKRMFREATAELLEDRYPATGQHERADLQRRLLAMFKNLIPGLPLGGETLEELLGRQVSLGMLTDLVGYTLDFGLAFKQRLLEEVCVDARATLLLDELKHKKSPCASQPPARGLGGFPPQFSVN